MSRKEKINFYITIVIVFVFYFALLSLSSVIKGDLTFLSGLAISNTILQSALLWYILRHSYRMYKQIFHLGIHYLTVSVLFAAINIIFIQFIEDLSKLLSPEINGHFMFSSLLSLKVILFIVPTYLLALSVNTITQWQFEKMKKLYE